MTPSNQDHNVQVPRLEAVISREVLWTTTVTLKLNHWNKKRQHKPKNTKVTDALAPLAVHKLVNVMAATINNNTVTLNVQETLPILLHTVDTEEFAKYDSVTPAELGCLASCEDAVEPMTF